MREMVHPDEIPIAGFVGSANTPNGVVYDRNPLRHRSQSCRQRGPGGFACGKPRNHTGMHMACGMEKVVAAW